MNVTEKIEGVPKSKRESTPRLWLRFLLLPIRILVKLIGDKKNYIEISDSPWESFFPFPMEGTQLEKKLIAETGFDGHIKFYRIRTENQSINSVLENKTFGEFHWENESGIYLREFENVDDWPVSYFVQLDKSNFQFRRLVKVDSSFVKWKYEHVNETEFNVVTYCTETHTSWIEIRNEKPLTAAR